VNLDPKKILFLIDGSSFLYRAYYGVRPLHTSKGVPVQAVYSFCRMIKKLIDKFNPEYMAVVWDSKGKTVRHEIYADYKGTRQAPPSDLFVQKEKIVEFANLIGIKQIEEPGWEADDLMHSIVKDQTKAGNDVVLVTSDKDMGQTLSDQVVIYDAFKDVIINKTVFDQKMEFPSEKLPFYFALVGDSSDNIPGVRGIGDKTATQLVQQFDSLKDLYQHLDRVAKPSARKALEENKDKAFLSEQLFLLRYYPTKLTKEDFAFNPKNWEKARSLFVELEFKSLLKELGITKEERQATVEEKIAQLQKYNLKTVVTEDELDELAKELKSKKVFAVDTEGTSLDAMESELVGLSFCAQEGTAYYVPFGHKTKEPQLSKEQVLKILKPILEDPVYKKYLHNTKFDQHILANHGVQLQGAVFDTLVAASLVTKDWQRLGLKYLSVFYFDEPMLTFEEIVKQAKLKNFSYLPLQLATYYSAHDAHQTFRFAHTFMQELKKEGMETLYFAIEHPLIQVLFAMELEGIYLDTKELVALDKKVTHELERIENEIRALIGDETKKINLNSPKQIEELLFTTLHLPPQKKSAKGTGYSTDHEVLTELAKLHPVPGLILKHRELAKLKSTYLDALPTYINKNTGLIHTTFSQTGVATGRLASSDPNLQNIPSGGALGYGAQIRTAFKPKQGHAFIAADYSQIELRVLAYLSQDENLMNAFLKGKDIHSETAALLFDVPLDKVTGEQRQIGKRINFSILYGLTPYGLSKDLGIPFKDAKMYIEKYFQQYPKVSAWMEKTIEFVKEHGFVTTHWGRRRYVPGIYERNRALYEEARRVAINTVAQGTAAEILKQAMIALEKIFAQHGLDAQMILQIHDELLISVSIKDAAKVEQLTKKTLESIVDWNVPLVVMTRTGENWKAVTK
jgi:DNA polymerase-1